MVMEMPMLASHDVFSHTGPPTAKFKRGGLVCIASHNARFLTGVTILYHTATGVLFVTGFGKTHINAIEQFIS